MILDPTVYIYMKIVFSLAKPLRYTDLGTGCTMHT